MERSHAVAAHGERTGRIPEPTVRQILDDLSALEEQVRQYGARIEAGEPCGELLVHGSTIIDHLRRITRFFLLAQLRSETGSLHGGAGEARDMATRQAGYLHAVL